jgi:hypothetical protein
VQGEPITFWDNIIAFFGAICFWLTGESGRVLVASGLGGLVRWFSMEKRRIRTGVMSIVGGAICGFYLWPIILRIPTVWGAEIIDKAPENIAMAGFLAGTIGVSAVKIITAIVEARGLKLAQGSDPDA